MSKKRNFIKFWAFFLLLVVSVDLDSFLLLISARKKILGIIAIYSIFFKKIYYMLHFLLDK